MTDKPYDHKEFLFNHLAKNFYYKRGIFTLRSKKYTPTLEDIEALQYFITKEDCLLL